MANIRQQKKRIRIAADQRIENLRYRSTIKTLTKRLATVGRRRRRRGDPRRASQPRPLDRQGRHPRRAAQNTGARKKSQAAKLASPKA